MTLKVKLLHPDAKIPTRATEAAAGYDLYAIEDTNVFGAEPYYLPTGLAIEIPPGWVGEIRDRSSSAAYLHAVAGTIDSDFRGEVIVMLHSWMPQALTIIKSGQRIAQLVIVPCLQEPVEVVAELSETARGAGGFGSTGE